ncbi:MAG: energy transducer TonB [Bdellovibrionales bacterium CG10_big_fil_rev_8_21_14_0_10_45_34]|nr:MAG: energy transducer TonB [Bdellovibrionales bacterium CG10_big_fil_rev_8_21_14_0_10_45_34]
MIRNKTKISFSLSLLLHIVALIAMLLQRPYSTMPPSNEEIEVTYLDEKDPSEAAKLLNSAEKQIVDQSEQAVNDEVPEDSKFLSRNNQRVVRETKAPFRGDFNNQAGQLGSEEKAEDKNKPDSANEGSVLAEESGDGVKSAGSVKMKDLIPKFNWDLKAASKGQKLGTPSANDDYLKEIEVGVQTLLSTREFVYFSYYKRIKDRIGLFWEPKIKQKVSRMFRQGRQLASRQDRITKLLILLDRNGTLVGVQVLDQSGVLDLDDAAIEAFKEAAPFPNPPEGIVESDGRIRIRWDFVIEA